MRRKIRITCCRNSIFEKYRFMQKRIFFINRIYLSNMSCVFRMSYSAKLYYYDNYACNRTLIFKKWDYFFFIKIISLQRDIKQANIWREKL